MSQTLQLAHFGLRTRNLPAAIECYAKALDARVHFQNELAAFMSFDEEHHRFVLWDDGETGEKPEDARGVDHIGFGCGGPAELADQYDRLKSLGIMPALCVNHHFTSSIYYRDPDGNEVEITCDNRPTKAGCLLSRPRRQRGGDHLRQPADQGWLHRLHADERDGIRHATATLRRGI